MLKKVFNIIFFGLGIFWVLFIFNEYFNTHVTYFETIVQFQYFDLIIYFLIFTFIFLSSISKPHIDDNLTFKNMKLNGLKILGYIVGLGILIITVNGFKSNNLFQNYNYFKGIFIFSTKFLWMIFGLYMTTLFTSAAGSFLLNLMRIKTTGLRKLLYSTGIGIIIIVLILMGLGAYGLLKPIIVIPVLVTISIIAYKHTIWFLRTTLIDEICEPENEISFSIVFLTSLLVFNFVINLIGVTRPIPIGWDDLGVYMNIPNILYKTGSLMIGQNAYYYSLFMSLGFIVFKTTSLALGISYLGSVLAMGSLFLFARKFLKVVPTLMLLVTFYSLSSVSFLSNIDMKTDMGLLFMSLIGINLIFDCFKYLREKADELAENKKPFLKNVFEHSKFVKYIILVGMIAGFLFGSKYTMFILIIAFGSMIMYHFMRERGLIISFLTAMILVFQLNLFKYSGVEFDEQTAQLITYFSAGAIVITLITYIFKRPNWKNLYYSIIAIFVFGFTIFLTFSPWLIKNYSETKKISTNTLLYGKNTMPSLSISAVNKRYKNLHPEQFENNIKENSKIINENQNSKQKIDHNGSTGDTATKTTRGDIQDEKDTSDSDLTHDLDFKSSGLYESVTRYLGYDKGALRFLTVPYDITLNINTGPRTVYDIGYLLIMVLPLLIIWVFKVKKQSYVLPSIILLIAIFGFLLTSFVANHAISECPDTNSVNVECVSNSLETYLESTRNVWDTSNMKITGFLNGIIDILFGIIGFFYQFLIKFVYLIIGISVPFLVLLYNLYANTPGIVTILISIILVWTPCILLYIAYKDNPEKKLITAFLAVFMTLWLLLGNGIYWYGMLGFVVLYMLVFILSEETAKDKINNAFRWFMKGNIYIWMFVGFFLIFSVRTTRLTTLYVQPFLEYMIGASSADEVLNLINPAFPKAIDAINANPDSKIYRVGTMLPYFLDDNYLRVMPDNQLVTFQSLYNNSKSKEEIAEKMMLGGFKFLILSFDGKNLDLTEDKTLTKKFNALEDFLYDNKKVKLISTDRLIKDENGPIQVAIDGEPTKVNYGFEREFVRYGNVFVFELVE